MTADRIDIEALSKRAGYLLLTQGPDVPAATARETVILLDMLASDVRKAAAKAWEAGRLAGFASAIDRTAPVITPWHNPYITEEDA